MTTIFDTPEGIDFFQLAARKGALTLEIAGLGRRGQSVYSICKEAYGLKGSRAKVLDQMEAMVETKLKPKCPFGTHFHPASKTVCDVEPCENCGGDTQAANALTLYNPEDFNLVIVEERLPESYYSEEIDGCACEDCI